MQQHAPEYPNSIRRQGVRRVPASALRLITRFPYGGLQLSEA